MNERVPGIRRDIAGGSAVVFGCDGAFDWNAKGACPWLRCEVAILNSGSVEVVDEIKLQGGPVSDDGSKQLIVGTATSPRPGASPARFVHCLIEAERIVSAGVITKRQYEAVRCNHEWL